MLEENKYPDNDGQNNDAKNEGVTEEVVSEEVSECPENIISDSKENDDAIKAECGDAPRKAPRTVSLSSLVVSIICVALAAIMITYTVCLNLFKRQQADNIVQGGTPAVSEGHAALDVFKTFFETFSFQDIDDDALTAAALKAYVEATGDRYAEYYTAEEWKALTDESEGKAQGIGINIINSTCIVNGEEFKAFKIINIMKGSPSEGKLKLGDYIAFVGNGEESKSVNELDYTLALSELKGEAGTVAHFGIYRENESGRYDKIDFSIERAAVTTTSVYYHVSTLDPKVGVIKILQFDMTTPTQFCEAVDELRASGCDKFVFDLRYNPGGALDSIQAVLSYFLDEGNEIIHTSDKNGNYVTTTVTATPYVTAEEFGKYKGMNAVILCNGSTASAAELFTATFRDYGLATTVGTKTYGKGSMQSLYSLASYGVEGGLRLTTKKYYPPCGESYDGIGITPDVVVELDEALKNVSVYDIPDHKDNQLIEALKYLK